MLLDYYDFGKDYWKTLKVWQEKFLEKKEKIRGQGFDEAFIRSGITISPTVPLPF